MVGDLFLDFMLAYDILIYGTSYHLIGIGTGLEKFVEN